MSKIDNILKPKTKSQIEHSICEEYGIEVSSKKEIKKVMNLLKMLEIIHTDVEDKVTCSSFSFEEVPREDVQVEVHHSFEIDGENYQFEIEGIREIKTILHSHTIHLIHPIWDWNEIYKQIIEEMVLRADVQSANIVDEKEIVFRIMKACNSIAVETRRGPGDFVIGNKKTIKRISKHLTGFLTHIKIIEDNMFSNDVLLIGRKTQMMDRGLHLVKNKRFYNIHDAGDLNKFYICLNLFDK